MNYNSFNDYLKSLPPNTVYKLSEIALVKANIDMEEE